MEVKEIKNVEKLLEVHPSLRLLIAHSAQVIPIHIITGHRGEIDQNKAFFEGKSKVKYPDGKHNQQPSRAIDIAPLPLDWNDTKRFYYLAGIIKAFAFQLNIKIKWGGDWDGDNDFKDQSFNDLAHFELI